MSHHRRQSSSSAVLTVAVAPSPDGKSLPENKRLASAPSATTRKKAGFGEVAGSTTAECAAVVCCCPCGLLDLVILAAVRLPAGLCRQALMKRRRSRRCRKQQRLATLLGATAAGRAAAASTSFDEDSVLYRRILIASGGAEDASWPPPPMSMSMSPEASKLEEEMLAQFYGAGFWRSPQKDQ